MSKYSDESSFEIPTSIEDRMHMAEEGIDQSWAEEWMRKLPIDRAKLLGVIGISQRVFQKRKKLKPDESERIMWIDDVWQRAMSVFPDADKAQRWLSAERSVLGRRSPLSACKTSYGKDEVIRLLGRIAHGVFS